MNAFKRLVGDICESSINDMRWHELILFEMPILINCHCSTNLQVRKGTLSPPDFFNPKFV